MYKGNFLKTLLIGAFIIPVFMMSNVVQAQSSAWQIGGDKNEEGRAIASTADGGYVVLGTTTSFGEGNADIYVAKISGNHQLEWTSVVGGIGADIGNSIQQTKDKGYIISGYTNSYRAPNESGLTTEKLYVVKLDAVGNIDWTLWGTSSGENSRLLDIKETKDGSFIGVGRASSGTTGSNSMDIYMIKINRNGNLVWQKWLGGIGLDIASGLTLTNDDGFVITGTTNSFGSNGSDLYIVKLDSLAEMQWSLVINDTLNELGYSITPTSDGSYVIVGAKEVLSTDSTAVNYDVLAMKVNDTGGIVWSATIGGSGDDIAYSVRETKDKGFIIGAYSTSFSTEPAFYTIKLNSSGDLEWSNIIENQKPMVDIREGRTGVIELLNGSYVGLNTGKQSIAGTGDNKIIVSPMDVEGHACLSNYVESKLKIIQPSSIRNQGNYYLTATAHGSGGTHNAGGEMKDICKQNNILEQNRGYGKMFELFPNPTKDQLNIKINSNEFQNVDFRIYDALGRKIIEKSVRSNNNNLPISLKELNSGIYFIHLKTQDGQLEYHQFMKY